MIHKIAQYTVEQKSIDTAISAIAEFVQSIRRNEPDTEYIAYRITGTNSFIHFMAFPDDEAEQAHRSAPYTQQFVEVIYPLCMEQPVFTDLDKIQGLTGGEYE